VPVIALCGFAAYFINVLLGAMGVSVFLTDIGEMLTLLVSAMFFVIFILQRESAVSQGNQSNNQ
jgi:hypothetical protein